MMKHVYPDCFCCIRPNDAAPWYTLCMGLIFILSVAGCDRSPPGSPTGTPTGTPPGTPDESATSTPADTVSRYVPGDQTFDDHTIDLQPAIEPAPKPTAPLPPGASCLTDACHARFASDPYRHRPVSEQSCQSCHDKDQGDHTFPLIRSPQATCTFCHPVVGTRRYQHKAVDDPGCIGCHDPHASQTKFLLTETSVDRLCATCHQIPWRRYAHEPFAFGKCTVCHRPHQSDARFLLRGGEGPDHCFMCHTDLRYRMANSPVIHEPAAKACTNCHAPHTSDYPHQLKVSMQKTCFECHKEQARHVAGATVSHEALFTADRCGNCHDPHAAGRPNLLRDRVDRLCLQCHDKPIQLSPERTIAAMSTQLKQKYLHGPVKTGNCTACHNAHGSTYVRLLRDMFPENFYMSFDLANYTLCFRCHNKDLVLTEKTTMLTDFRDGDVNLHYVHVHRKQKGRTCKTCHSIHASDLPKHMASQVPFEGSNWPMPIRYQKLDQGGKCAPGCHEPKSYDRTRPPRKEIAKPSGGAS